MKQKDPRRQLLNEALDGIRRRLSNVGYTRYGDTFNRVTEPGLTHVVNLQLSKYVTEFEFTVNLGIYLDEVAEVLRLPRAPNPPVKESQCQLRTRLSEIMTSGKDVWSRLDRGSTEEVGRALEDYGLPFLERFTSRAKIVQEWERLGSKYWPSWTNPLIAAVLLANAGKREEANRVLRREYEQTRGEPRAKQVEETIRKLGFEVSAA